MGKAASPSDTPRGRRLTESTPCLGCGYQLAGLQYDSLCPECAKPIKETVEELDALGPMGKQTRWMLGSLSVLTVLSFVGFVIYFGLVLFSETQLLVTGWPIEPMAVGAVAASVTSFAQVAVIYPMLNKVRGHSAYAVIRLGLERPLLWMFVTSVFKALTITGQAVAFFAFAPFDQRLHILILLCIGVAVICSMHAKMQFVTRLQAMIGHRKRADAAYLRTWGIPILMGILLALGLLFRSFLCFFVLAIPVVAISYWYTLAFAAVSLHRPRLKA